jgi:hypothetical protein
MRKVTPLHLLREYETASPGTKLAVVHGLRRDARSAFAEPETAGPGECEECGMPAHGTRCGRCALVRQVETKRARELRFSS